MATPRRVRMDQWKESELAIYKAMQEVEKMPPDVRLTNAVIKLAEAKNLVADFIDEVERMKIVKSNPPIEQTEKR